MDFTEAQFKALVEEMLERTKDANPECHPFPVEFSGTCPKQTRSKQWDLSKVTFDVDDDLYQLLRVGTQEHYRLKGILWVEPDSIMAPQPKQKQKRAPKQKPPKPGRDDWGEFWKEFRFRLLHWDSVLSWLGIQMLSDVERWEKLHEKYSVTTMRLVDPEQIIRELDEAGLTEENKVAFEIWERISGQNQKHIAQQSPESDGFF